MTTPTEGTLSSGTSPSMDPGPLRELVEIFLQELPSFIKKGGREPATLMSRLRSRFDKEVDAISEERAREFVAFLASPILEVHSRAKAASLDALHSEDPRWQALMALIAEVEARKPETVFSEIEPYWSTFRVEKLAEVLDPLMEARGSVGELRARAVVRTVAAAAELLYFPYLGVVWRLTCHSRGEEPGKLEKSGVLVQNLVQRLPQGSPLCDSDAGWLRNAAAHGSWRYLSETDSLELWDLKRSPKILSTTELLARVEGWSSLSAKLLRDAIFVYLGRNWKWIRSEIEGLGDSLATKKSKDQE